MKLENYFAPLSPEAIPYEKNDYLPSLGQRINAYWQNGTYPDLSQVSLALLGVCDERGSDSNNDGACAPDAIRSHLYGLALPNQNFQCADLGNLVLGHSLDDTCFALTEIVSELLEKNITVVILGGSQSLAMANYKAYESLGRIINVASIDARFDIEEQATLNARSWIYHIVLQQPNYLFNFANLAHQSYLCGERMLSLMEQLQFDVIRLGDLQGNGITAAEPLLRWSDMVSVDLCSVRWSDAPAARGVSPHGLYGEQLCQLMRFAGMSDKVSSIGFYELDAARDTDGHTASLAAQAIWHFLEGFFARMGDSPYYDKANYRRFLVPLNGCMQEIVFYKSKKSDRWWMQVPSEEENSTRYKRHLLIPCTYDDYQQALKNELPARWWRVYQRVN
ncbi:MAG: formimidoylglutamase [Bacteroidales bacterium]|nr:formimidoylglutamase [Bacteroidales bacterium]